MKGKPRKTKGDIVYPRYQSDEVIDKFVRSDSDMYACCVLLNDILAEEGYKGAAFFSNQHVLDLDRYELRTCGAQQGRTVDFIVGCEKMVLLLCEAKFRISGVARFVKELPEKIKHSKEILCSSDSFVSAFPVAIVLLPEKDFHQNERKFYNLFNNNPRMARVMTVKDFYNRFFC